MRWVPFPLYLHFLDRELGRSVGYTLTAVAAESILKCLLLGTSSRFYCSLSHIWESPAVSDDDTATTREIISLLVERGTLDVVSHHATVEEFLETRRALYAHDRSRYWMYFESEPARQSLSATATNFKTSSTTLKLAEYLGKWAIDSSTSPAAENPDLHSTVKKAVLERLAQRETQAITFALFRPTLIKSIGNSDVGAGFLRRQISKDYTKHYMEYCAADIPTGIRGLGYFENISENFPLFDVALIGEVLRGVGLTAVDQPWRAKSSFWYGLVEKRGSDLAQIQFCSQLRLLLKSLFSIISDQQPSGGPSGEIFAVRERIAGAVREPLARLAAGPIPFDGMAFDRAGANIRNILGLLRQNRAFAEHLERIMYEEHADVCDVLLITTTEIERDTVLDLVKKSFGRDQNLRFGRRRTYFDLGIIGGARVSLVQCEMGSGAPGASHATVVDAIDDLHPHCVLMVGIAFGVNPTKQELGQILVSRQLQCYELQRVGTSSFGHLNIELRGDRATASTKLLGRLRATAASWDGARVAFGVLLSGEKLIDNIEFRDRIAALVPEAIGGEMEGAGLYTAAFERNVDWIVVKAICDWADGKKCFKKSERQLDAAHQSAEFVLRAIEQGGFTSAVGTIALEIP